MDPNEAPGHDMRLFADLLEDDHSGEIKPLLWESRAATGAPVGKCGCGRPLTARPAERPPYSAVTYRDVHCTNGHEASIVGRYQGPAMGYPAGVVDVTAARHTRDKD